MAGERRKMLERISCFEPVVFDDSRVLVLGTLPGAKSLETGFYYADKRNYFWKFLSYYAGETELPETKQDKIELLKKTKVAIWDVYASGYRGESSKDKDIKDGIPNDILLFLKLHPSIVKVGASKPVYEIVKKKLPFLEVACLPSTSFLEE